MLNQEWRKIVGGTVENLLTVVFHLHIVILSLYNEDHLAVIWACTEAIKHVTSAFKNRICCAKHHCKHMAESIFLVTLGRFSEWGKTCINLLKLASEQVQVPEIKHLSKPRLRTPKAPFKAINANVEKVPVLLGWTESIWLPLSVTLVLVLKLRLIVCWPVNIVCWYCHQN